LNTNDKSTLDEPFDAGTEHEQRSESALPNQQKNTLAQIWETIVRIGLGESALRVGAAIASLALVLLVVWVMRDFYLKGERNKPVESASGQVATTSEAVLPAVVITPDPVALISGITRLADLHTTIPSRPRFTMTQYTVKEGDNLTSIADQFGLKPQSLFWGNPDTLFDPHSLKVGQVLNILPTDGVVYEWHQGDGLNGVAEFYHVTPEDIIDWPGNNLTRESVGDYAAPNIEPGTEIFIPGGTGDLTTWTIPRITREDPAQASTLGPGYCGAVYNGVYGTDTFIWPAATRYISGYHYQPEINHYGIDIGGSIGVGIYAADNGVIVYAGWNNNGYGNLIVIDHGNGWQTYYAHLDTVQVQCGQSVYQGDQIALMGSTGNSSGPHLHFEMRSDVFGKVDPLNYVSP
jgi:murein DD-endopeptidase MepM/ murein hydrolase activator NlpD